MSKILTITTVVVIIVIVLVIVIIVCRILEIRRYFKFKSKRYLKLLDKRYHKRPRVDSPCRVVITMSTIPDRISVLYPTLASLLDQSVRVDEIAINVPYVSRKGIKYRIPGWLKDMKSVTVHRIEKDEGPATKLLPTIARESTISNGCQTRIIVVDDDNIYHSRTVERLIERFEQHASIGHSTAITNFGVRLYKDGKIPKFFSMSRTADIFCASKEVDLLQGCHGFVVTPNMFPKEALDLDNRPPEAISVDDIWFSCWLHVNKIPIYSLGYTYLQMPLVNFGEVNETPKLVNGENKGLVRDQNVVDWFIRTKGFIPINARS